ncbi:1,5-anhydro-D-fructose reductase isoform X2 [Corythoichthys intestinalis]|nr:1,5-anhydro-D-fructose reductase isoform X2 [Corythoichthys intestinalis]
MFIVSKLLCTCDKPEGISLSLNKSLTNLQLDYLDLYLIHEPTGLKKMDEEHSPRKDGHFETSDMDYEGVWMEMEGLQASGKVRSIGVSNFNTEQLEKLLSFCKVPPAVNQVELHLHQAQHELTEFCKSRDIAITAHNPFGSPAKSPPVYREDMNSHNLLDEQLIANIARKYKRSPSQVLLRYYVQQGIAVIPRSYKSHHILENTKIFYFSLSEEDMTALRGLK